MMDGTPLIKADTEAGKLAVGVAEAVGIA